MTDWIGFKPFPIQEIWISVGGDFIQRMDAIVMGRKTFQKVCGLGCPWPYPLPVFVLSSTLESVPREYDLKAEVIRGSVSKVLSVIHERGHKEIYIDGGTVIQSFLRADLIDEMIVTVLPILLGVGSPLFGALADPIDFDLIKSDVLLDAMWIAPIFCTRGYERFGWETSNSSGCSLC